MPSNSMSGRMGRWLSLWNHFSFNLESGLFRVTVGLDCDSLLKTAGASSRIVCHFHDSILSRCYRIFRKCRFGASALRSRVCYDEIPLAVVGKCKVKAYLAALLMYLAEVVGGLRKLDAWFGVSGSAYLERKD